MPTAALAPAAALAGAGFRRWSTYRQAALAGVFVNTVFGVIRLSILLGVAESAGGEVEGYDAASLSTYTWVAQGDDRVGDDLHVDRAGRPGAHG